VSTRFFTKPVAAVLDYEFDWQAAASTDNPKGPWLETGETITAATVTVDTGLSVDSSPHTTTTVTVWLSGGTEGHTYDVTCHITTNQGRQDEDTIRVTIGPRT
jgi:hypothetical protein